MERNISKEHLFSVLSKQYEKLESEITYFRDVMNQLLESGEYTREELTSINNDLIIPVLEQYSHAFQEITSQAHEEYLNPEFRELYGQMALSLGYLNVQIENHGNTAKYYDIAEIYSDDPLLKFQLNLVSIRHRHELAKMFPSFNETFLKYLCSTAKQLLTLFVKESKEELLHAYINTHIPYSFLIEAMESISGGDSNEEICKYAVLAYLQARAGSKEKSEEYIRLSFNTKGTTSDSLFMFFSDIYKWWY